jgi:hypothetical protein
MWATSRCRGSLTPARSLALSKDSTGIRQRRTWLGRLGCTFGRSGYCWSVSCQSCIGRERWGCSRVHRRSHTQFRTPGKTKHTSGRHGYGRNERRWAGAGREMGDDEGRVSISTSSHHHSANNRAHVGTAATWMQCRNYLPDVARRGAICTASTVGLG